MRIKRTAAALLAGVMLAGTMGNAVHAQEVKEAEKKEKKKEKTLEEKAADKAYAMTIESNKLKGWPKGPGTHGEAGIVMDVESGAILYAKNIDAKEYPASITKVLTALVAMENGNFSDQVTFTDDCVSFIQPGDSSIGMKKGEVISLEDAMYGMMLASANEAAYAIAANVGESYESFIAKMNERAAQLGCKNSNFVNANGLHDKNHYTSARDMALIGSEAAKHEEFFKIMQTLQYTIKPTNLVKESRTFQQKHKMLRPGNKYYYENCIGGKTGFTKDARATLITYAQKSDMKLVSVVLRTHGQNIFPDTRKLFDYAYKNFEKVAVKGQETSKDIESIPDDAYVVLPKGIAFKDLTSEITSSKEDGVKTGTVSYTYNGHPVGSIKVTLSDSYFEKTRLHAASDKQENNKTSVKKSVFFWILTGIGCIIVILIIIAVVVSIHKKKKKKRWKKKKRRRNRNHRKSKGSVTDGK